MTPGVRVRPAVEADLAAVVAIYNHAVEHSIATFDVDPAEPGSWRARLGAEHPGVEMLVAVDDSTGVVGFAYAGPFRPRPAYSRTCETSIYIHPESRGQGVGKVLYPAILDAMTRTGMHTAIAALALPNPPSVRLHEACGFRRVGEFREVGNKFGRWIDIAWYQRLLTESQVP